MKLKAYSILCLVLILAFAWTVPAFAASWDSDAVTKLTLQYQFLNEETDESQPLSGGSFRVYRVGDASNNGIYHLTLDGYEKQSLSEMTTELWTAEAKAMSDYVRGKRTIQPLETQKTDETGTLTFSDVTSTGLYLVVGDPLTKDGWTYTPNPFLVMLPSYGTDGGWDYEITSTVKVTRTPYSPGPGPRPSPSPSPSPEPSTKPSEDPSVSPEPSEDPSVSPEPSEDPSVSPEPSTGPSAGPEVSPEPSTEPSTKPSISPEPRPEQSAGPAVSQDPTVSPNPSSIVSHNPNPPSPTVTVKPTPTPAAQLPKTGTRMWLVPYLVAIGCVMIGAGIALRGRRRHG